MTANFESQANITVSWLEGRETFQADIVIYTTGLELDEVVDALHTGLAATEGRKYTLESAKVSEIVVRDAQPSALAKKASARPIKTRPTRPNNPSPVTPRPDQSRIKTGEKGDAEVVPSARRQTREGDREAKS